ncbi:MAG: alpha/beta hydrolase family protein, partial [Mycobacteriales bacterium]
PDGTRIEGLLCTPAGEGPHPLVIKIHGGPVWSYRNLWSLFYAWTPLLVAAGYAVLSPNPRGSSGRGQDFARQVFGDMGGADTYDFTSAVDALADCGLIDPDRVGVMGGSYGGFMSSWLVTQDQRWAAAVPISPVTDWYSQHFSSNIPYFDQLFLAADETEPGSRFHSRSPVMQASRVTTPCLNVAGALDRCTPPTQAQEFHQALLEHGVESQLVIYPLEGHGVRAFPALNDFCTRLLDWFERHMPT